MHLVIIIQVYITLNSCVTLTLIEFCLCRLSFSLPSMDTLQYLIYCRTSDRHRHVAILLTSVPLQGIAHTSLLS